MATAAAPAMELGVTHPVDAANAACWSSLATTSVVLGTSTKVWTVTVLPSLGMFVSSIALPKGAGGEVIQGSHQPSTLLIWLMGYVYDRLVICAPDGPSTWEGIGTIFAPIMQLGQLGLHCVAPAETHGHTPQSQPLEHDSRAPRERCGRGSASSHPWRSSGHLTC